jgi:hypothetical protein
LDLPLGVLNDYLSEWEAESAIAHKAHFHNALEILKGRYIPGSRDVVGRLGIAWIERLCGLDITSGRHQGIIGFDVFDRNSPPPKELDILLISRDFANIHGPSEVMYGLILRPTKSGQYQRLGVFCVLYIYYHEAGGWMGGKEDHINFAKIIESCKEREIIII